jgi:Arc/MetJ family transcription regulator
MRIIVDVDDELLATAREFTGLQDVSALVREAISALVARESARRLALLGGTEPGFEVPPRRRLDPE